MAEVRAHKSDYFREVQQFMLDWCSEWPLLRKYDLGKYNTPHQLKTEKTEDAKFIDLHLRKTKALEKLLGWI